MPHQAKRRRAFEASCSACQASWAAQALPTLPGYLFEMPGIDVNGVAPVTPLAH